jgi:hypothetical protein
MNQTISPMTTQITINDSIDPPLSRELKTGGIPTGMPPAPEITPRCQWLASHRIAVRRCGNLAMESKP